MKADGTLDTVTTPTAASTYNTALFTSGTKKEFNGVNLTWTYSDNSATAAVVKVQEEALTAVEVAAATAKYVTVV